MGYNTGVIILNDAIGAIEANPEEFVRNLRLAMGNFIDGKRQDISCGNHVNAAAVFHQSHADSVGVYALGGNHASKLLEVYNGGHHYTEQDKLSLLKQLADEMGYKIVAKPKPVQNKGGIPKGISPKDVVAMKKDLIPAEVFTAFDELIAKNHNGRSATVMQNEAIELIMKKLKAAGNEVTRQDVFENHWLDVEDIYRKAGWKVEYDKPGYCESYEANFTFTGSQYLTK